MMTHPLTHLHPLTHPTLSPHSLTPLTHPTHSPHSLTPLTHPTHSPHSLTASHSPPLTTLTHPTHYTPHSPHTLTTPHLPHTPHHPSLTSPPLTYSTPHTTPHSPHHPSFTPHPTPFTTPLTHHTHFHQSLQNAIDQLNIVIVDVIVEVLKEEGHLSNQVDIAYVIRLLTKVVLEWRMSRESRPVTM